MTNVRPLFVGRFQPFHKGHLAMVRRIVKEHNGLVFGVGSSQFRDTQKNPFSFDERARMIRSMMREEGFEDYDIIAIKDLNNDELWIGQVMELVPDLEIIYSNDSLTIRLFEEKGFDVRVLPLIERQNLSGTEVRRRIRESENWEELVPDSVREILEDTEGLKRMRTIPLEKEEDK